MGPAMIAFTGAIVLAAIYCKTNPFKHGAMAGFPGFETYEVELAPTSEVPSEVDADDRLTAAEVRFVDQVQGPESIAFDPHGGGPYTGVADGRVLAWNGEAWKDFAYTSPNRSAICDPKLSLLSYVENEHICGRPLGLRFNKKTGDLYICDAYFGLLKVGPQGGLASSLSTEAEGVPFRFTNDLDIDEEGNVYFTVSSSTYYRRNFLQAIFTGERSGRLLKYNPVTKETMVLLHGIQFPNGISLSKDGSFLLFCETARSRLTKYWLKGEKSGTTELFALLPGKLLKILEDRQGKVVRAASEIEERDGKLWIGSVLMPFIAVYDDGDH
ncbi:Strictosidine synthase 3 [Platanthera guangdongensis]|uniref:Strictosidine synthase 3 n=1 Tax=Platanthera guangdongensis TaxID=2320717 RepID=A0ABR2MTR7_9ASPA